MLFDFLNELDDQDVRLQALKIVNSPRAPQGGVGLGVVTMSERDFRALAKAVAQQKVITHKVRIIPVMTVWELLWTAVAMHLTAWGVQEAQMAHSLLEWLTVGAIGAFAATAVSVAAILVMTSDRGQPATSRVAHRQHKAEKATAGR